MKSIAAAPREAEARQWQRTTVAVAAVGATMLLDDEFRRVVLHNDSHFLDEATGAVEPLGGGHAPKLIAVTLIYGAVRGDQRAKAVGFDALMASLIASRVLTPALKEITQRTRPNGGDYSFPSNHTTEAFALAGVVASHYRQPWVRATAYGLATGVAFSRIYHDAHWASDTVAGAIIGNVVARKIVRVNDEQRLRWSIVPSRRGFALMFSIDGGRVARRAHPDRSAGARTRDD